MFDAFIGVVVAAINSIASDITDINAVIIFVVVVG